MKGAGVLQGVPVEEGPAELTVAPGRVVLTCIAHTSTHVARCEIQGHVKVTTAGVPMALAFWSRAKKVGMEWADPWQVWPDKAGHGTYPGRCACHGWSWYRPWQRSQWVPVVWWRQTQWPCT